MNRPGPGASEGVPWLSRRAVNVASFVVQLYDVPSLNVRSSRSVPATPVAVKWPPKE